MPASSTRWKPGQSGNPGGKPRDSESVIALARSGTRVAFHALLEIAGGAKKPPAARVAAAVALLDRGWGKPMQTLSASMAIEQIPAGIDAPPSTPETREEWLARRKQELNAIVSAVKASADPDATRH